MVLVVSQNTLVLIGLMDSRSATKDQMMKGRLKGSQMEAHTKFHMQNTYDAPAVECITRAPPASAWTSSPTWP